MQLKEYEYLFDVRIRSDSKARNYFQTEAGGSVLAAGSSGSITGFDSGSPGLDRFNGALVCFPHDELMHTEKGMMKIGEVVDRKLDVRVYSFNLKTREVELKEIERYFENPGSDLVEIGFEDGATLRCTPDHKVWTDNRGWVEAQDLLMSDQLLSPPPNCSLRESEHIPTVSLSNAEVFQYGDLIVSKLREFRDVLSNPLKFPLFNCFSPSYCASSYLMNGERVDPINFSDLFITSRARGNVLNLSGCQFAARMNLTSGECPVSHRVLDVLRASSIFQVADRVISWVSVQVSNICFFGLRPQKSPGYKLMNKVWPGDLVSCYCSSEISPSKFFGFCENFDSSRFQSKINAIFSKNLSFFGANSSKAGCAVKPIKTRNASPLFIRKIGHVDKTYCITVKDNHNMFMGSDEEHCKLVSNCDDLHKIDEAHSTTMREGVIENYSQTLQQRLRGLNTQVISIGQRVHENDISQYLIDGKDGYDWEKVILKSIDEAGNALYPEVDPLPKLLKRQETDPYVFASQYQQDPIPAGGALFKPEWFVLLDEEPEILYTFIVADTAETAKSYNDATAISFFGIYEIEYDGRKTGQYGLHWIDAIEVRVEPKDLKDVFMDFWSECMRYKKQPSLAAIEKKSTGVTLLSTLQEIRGIRIIDIPRSASSGSKTKRFLDSQPLIAERRVSLPTFAKHTKMCVEHMSKITANDSHRHDDLADNLCDGLRLALVEKSLMSLAVKKDDSTAKARSLMSTAHKIDSLRRSAYTR
jgi:predicted phage terminase large subunit-like protein